jgi:2-phospho-L-lactate guanylyltransferase
MNIWAIVPVKPLNRTKSRLADALSPDQREALATGMLMQTIRLLVPQPLVQGVLVISRDTKALSMVRELGAQTLQESGTPELNNALLRATRLLKTWRVDATLIVPADIPLLAAADVEEVITLGRYHHTVVIAPDRHEQGTNMLLIHPPGLIPYTFGENSFAIHKRLARQAEAGIQVYRSERVALDIDTPDDLFHYYRLAKALGEPMIEHGVTPDGLLLAASLDPK